MLLFYMLRSGTNWDCNVLSTHTIIKLICFAINFCSVQLCCILSASKDVVDHSNSSQERAKLITGTKCFILYLLEEADFLCVTLVLFFLRGQTLDWSLTPLSLEAI